MSLDSQQASAGTLELGAERLPLRSMLRGAWGRCPSCGQGRMFASYLKTVAACGHCGEELHHHRADDAPAYFTIVVVGHVIVSLVLSVEMALHPPLWLHAAIWMPLTIGMALVCLGPIKGAIVGLQWALGMHGFDPEHSDETPGDEPWR